MDNKEISKLKQDIFPLYVYVGKCKVRTPQGIVGGYYAIDTVMGGIECIVNDEGHPIQQSFFISDCQLCLKPLSKMSELDKELDDKISDLIWDKYGKNVRDTAIAITMLIIQNGYALDDQWFEKGIAVEG